jgi:hypothetical protein
MKEWEAMGGKPIGGEALSGEKKGRTVMATRQLVNLIGKVRDGSDARACCEALAAHYGAVLKYGPKEPLVGVLGAALEALGVKSKKAFVGSVAITVGDTIYLPFRVGVETVKFSLVTQVAIVAHECEHVRQGGEQHLEMWIRYFTSKAHRAEYEAKALAVTMEAWWRLTGSMPDALVLAQSLEWYCVSKADIRVTAKHLAIIANTLRQGGEICGQMKVIAKALVD